MISPICLPASAGGPAAAEAFLAFDEPPELIDFVTPEYPELARQAGFEGTVRVRVLVDEAGNVVEADLLSGTSGRRSRKRPSRRR